MVPSRYIVFSLLAFSISTTLMQATNVPIEEIQAALNAIPTQTQGTKEVLDAIKKYPGLNITVSGISNEELRLIIREELRAQRLPRRLMRSPFKLLGVLGLAGAWGYWFVETHEDLCRKTSIKVLENILSVAIPLSIYLKMSSKKPVKLPHKDATLQNNTETEHEIVELEKKD